MRKSVAVLLFTTAVLTLSACGANNEKSKRKVFNYNVESVKTCYNYVLTVSLRCSYQGETNEGSAYDYPEIRDDDPSLTKGTTIYVIYDAHDSETAVTTRIVLPKDHMVVERDEKWIDESFRQLEQALITFSNPPIIVD